MNVNEFESMWMTLNQCEWMRLDVTESCFDGDHSFGNCLLCQKSTLKKLID